MPKKVKKTAKQNSHYERLKRKWRKRHTELRRSVREKHREAYEWLGEKVPAREHVAGAAVGALMLSNTLPALTTAVTAAQTPPESSPQIAQIDKKELVRSHLSSLLPVEMRPLEGIEEAAIGQTLSDDFGFNISAKLAGHRLDRSYGFIGAEQHLMRYPGDLMHTHLNEEDLQDKYIYSSGMAPGRGAWGHFARSKAEMTKADIEREKWYIAAPTFLAPGFFDDARNHHDWFKYRKMLVVNPKTGQSVVVDIGDAGPAQWTGKHLGGSPEVMVALGLAQGPRKGAVLYYFIDDPSDKIPLGPVS